MSKKKDGTGFGARLRAIREEKGLTQQALGDLVDMHYQAVARLERGDRTPSWETVLKFAAALGITPDAFLGKPTKKRKRADD